MTDAVKSLRNLYRRDESARAVVDALARLPRSPVTEVDEIERGGVVRSEVVRVLKKLEALECGTFIVGRRQKPSRMRWRVAPWRLRAVAEGEHDALDPIDLDDDVDPYDDDEPAIDRSGGAIGAVSRAAMPPPARATPHSALKTHSYPLRKDLTVRLELPADFNKADAERLIHFIQGLPFD